MAKRRQKVWQQARRTPGPAVPDVQEKLAIISACETVIRDILKPRFLPEIRPTQWNHVIDIHGAWAAGRYRFMQRYRSGHTHNLGLEFDIPFARIDRMGPDQFDIKWMRHTGQWWPLHSGVTMAEALHIVATDPALQRF